MSSGVHGRPRRAGGRWLVVGVSVVLAAVLAGGAALYLRGSTSAGSSASASASPKPKVTPLAVLATTPAAKATAVASDSPITVNLSTPLAQNSPMPALSPPVPGTWSTVSSDELQFVADGPLVPGTSETLTIPGGDAGLLAADGTHLASTVAVTFTVAQGSTLRLQQLLAQLGYLPLTFTPVTQPASPQQEAEPQQGTFAWRWPAQPAALTSQWVTGTYGIITKGAVVRFQTVNSLTTTGVAGPQTWGALLAAAAAGQTDPQPYDYVTVTKTLPETVTVYQNGAVAYSTPANTGVPGASTATGTFAVFEHVQTSRMTGTDVTGTHYTIPNVPWVSYFNGGDALHGYTRASYGFPQSNGCVEMPPANAAVVWPMTPLGTLVTVE